MTTYYAGHNRYGINVTNMWGLRVFDNRADRDMYVADNREHNEAWTRREATKYCGNAIVTAAANRDRQSLIDMMQDPDVIINIHLIMTK